MPHPVRHLRQLVFAHKNKILLLFTHTHYFYVIISLFSAPPPLLLATIWYSLNTNFDSYDLSKTLKDLVVVDLANYTNKTLLSKLSHAETLLPSCWWRSCHRLWEGRRCLWHRATGCALERDVTTCALSWLDPSPLMVSQGLWRTASGNCCVKKFITAGREQCLVKRDHGLLWLILIWYRDSSSFSSIPKIQHKFSVFNESHIFWEKGLEVEGKCLVNTLFVIFWNLMYLYLHHWLYIIPLLYQSLVHHDLEKIGHKIYVYLYKGVVSFHLVSHNLVDHDCGNGQDWRERDHPANTISPAGKYHLVIFGWLEVDPRED